MIKLGVVGYGNRMNGLVTKVFREAAPDLRVAAIVDPDEAGVRERLEPCDQDATFFDSLEQMVLGAQLDALAIGTRCNLHAAYGAQAAAYDLPLYLEKPIAVTMEQAIELEQAYENSDCQVVVSFPLRTSPLCVLARQYLEDGAVGSPVHITAVNYVPYGTVYWERFYRDWEISHGLFLQKATHDFDYMMYLMDSPIVRVGAMAARGHVFGGTKQAGLVCSECAEQEECLESPQNRRRNGTTGVHEDHACVFSVDCGTTETHLNADASSTVVEFASGAHGAYTQVCYARRDAGTRGATVSGYLGTVHFDWYQNELRRIRHHAPFSATEQAGSGMSHFGGDLELAHDFIGIIKGTAKSRTPIETGLRSVYACLAANRSADRGEFVTVRQVGD